MYGFILPDALQDPKEDLLRLVLRSTGTRDYCRRIRDCENLTPQPITIPQFARLDQHHSIMRVFIALVVALVSLLATNSAVLAATASNPNDLVPLTSPELIENRQRDSVRFLRKQENAELDNEE
ncbi:hypothetical protein GQ600_1900 [Phytophthora cactorum]|nr:hypothetical protein GQ600_1900 [Phytophthora cactorum]